jgi:hypothetical protein
MDTDGLDTRPEPLGHAVNETVADSLEFDIPEADQWWGREVHGLARIEPEYLLLEFRTTHLMGLLRTGVREIRIPWREITETAFDYRLLYSTVRCRLRSLKPLSDIPGVKGATLSLRVRGWSSRRSTRAFVAELEYQRALNSIGESPTATISDPASSDRESLR